MSKDDSRRRPRRRSAASKSASRKPAESVSHQKPYADIAIVAAVALVASIMCLANAFTLDDVPIIANAPRMHGLSHLSEIIRSTYWTPPFVPDLYRPLTLISLATQYTLGDGDPIVF